MQEINIQNLEVNKQLSAENQAEELTNPHGRNRNATKVRIIEQAAGIHQVHSDIKISVES